MGVDMIICPGELAKQSQFSPDPPGTVRDDEVIAKVVIAPEHLDAESGEIKHALIKKDDLKSNGTSVVRLHFSSKDEIKRLGEGLSSRRPENIFMGVICANVGAIRKIQNIHGKQALCVHDDGKIDFRSHALIFSSTQQTDGNIRKIRKMLLDTFGLLKSVESALSK